jgi:hypothetical protein
MIWQFLHNLTHTHTYVEKNGMRVKMCHPRFTRRAYITVQRWPGALWEPVESIAAMSEIIGVPLPGSEE